MSEHALVIGEALVDVVMRTDGSVDAHPGGSPANVAIGLGRLGRDVELLAYLADDDNGALVREHLAASQVSLAAGSLGAPATSVATAHLDDAGAATYEFELEWALAADAAPTPSPLVVHTGSIAAVLAPGAESVRDLVASFREGATVTYDPNARPSLMGEPADARAAIEAMVALADVVKVSDEDLEWLGWPYRYRRRGRSGAGLARPWARVRGGDARRRGRHRFSAGRAFRARGRTRHGGR